jgi:4a-hydroxytetrahydrobiopterin dehydratase
MSQVLKPDEIQAILRELPGWEYRDNSLNRTFCLNSFREAVSFLVRIAFEAEAVNHHPEIVVAYNRVVITLQTHDAGDRVTRRDADLAAAIQRISWVG